MAESEFRASKFEDLIAYRNTSLVNAEFLGPLDVCIITRQTDPYISFLSSSTKYSYLHWLLGVDTSSVAAICAYYQRLRALEKDLNSTFGEIANVTIATYNAFAGMDLRVVIDMNAKPAVVVYAVDTDLRRHDRVTEELQDGAFVSSFLRQIAMPPSIVPSLFTEKSLSPKIEANFLRIAARMLDKGDTLRGAESSALQMRHGTPTVLQTLVMRHFMKKLDPTAGIKFFTPIVAFQPLAAVAIARLYRMKGKLTQAAQILCEALYVAPKSVPILLEQADIMLQLQQPKLALPLAHAACEYGPLELRTWVTSARVHCMMKDSIGALFCLNSISEDLEMCEMSEADINDLINLPHDPPSNSRIEMRAKKNGGRPPHEWAFFDVERESDELAEHDVLGIGEIERQEPILSNRLHNQFHGAYKVLIDLLQELDFVLLDSLVRDLFYTGETRHAVSAAVATSDSSIISETVSGRAVESPAVAERKMRRLERRAAAVERKLKKFDRESSSKNQTPRHVESGSALVDTKHSREGSKSRDKFMDDSLGKVPSLLKPEINGSAHDNGQPSANDADQIPTRSKSYPHMEDKNNEKEELQHNFQNGGPFVVRSHSGFAAAPVVTVSRVFAQPSAHSRTESPPARIARAKAPATKSPKQLKQQEQKSQNLRKKAASESQEVNRRRVEKLVVSSENDKERESVYEGANGAIVDAKHGGDDPKVLAKRSKAKSNRRLERERKRLSEMESPRSLIAKQQTKWKTKEGDPIPRQLCGSQLQGLLTLLKEDIRAMHESRVELQKNLDDFGQDWYKHVAPMRTQYQWLQYAKVARRLRMYEEAETYLDLCNRFGFSRAAFAEQVDLFADADMLPSAVDTLFELERNFDDDKRNDVPKVIIEKIQMLTEKFGVGAVAEQIAKATGDRDVASDAPHRYVVETLEKFQLHND